MKKIFLTLLVAFLLFPLDANAQAGNAASAPAEGIQREAAEIMPPLPPDEKPANLFGQNHFYTITFRGNGEAVVTFKAILSNTTTTPLTKVSLDYPSNFDPKEFAAFQVIQEPQCIRYLPRPVMDLKMQDRIMIDPAGYTEQCAEYQQPTYQYLYGNTKYQNIKTEVTNTTLELYFPTPIEPNKHGSYFIYFRSNDLTKKDLFGAYKYQFQTLKTTDKIHSLQVGISTDADHYLRGAKANVNYASTDVAMAVPSSAGGSERSMSNPQFDQFYNQIGNGTITKHVSDLASLESYDVKGLYADSQSKLYGKEITITVIVILLLILLIIVLVKVALNKLAKKKADKPEEAVVQLKNQNKTFLTAISISFLSMLLLCLYTFGVFAITQLLNPSMYYSNNSMVLMLFVFAISCLVYMFFFFAPSIGMGVKKGLGWALVTFSATVVWAILFLLVLFALLLFLSPRNDGYPKPYPMMGIMEGRFAVDGGAPPVQIEPGFKPNAVDQDAAQSTTGEAEITQ